MILLKRIIPFFSIFLFSMVLPARYTRAQETIKKDVRVVKPYEPSISDAFKINMLPQISDTFKVEPSFSYKVKNVRIPVEYSPRPIRAAKMVGETIPKLYGSHLKLGFGTYTTPFAEVYINNLRSKDYTIGTYLKHRSSHGKVKLDNNKRVFAGNSEDIAQVYGTKFFNNFDLSGDLKISNDVVHYYGYNPDLDTSLIKDDIRQRYFSFSAGSKIKSSFKDSAHLNYAIGVNYDYTTDIDDNNENAIALNGKFNKIHDDILLGLNTDIYHFARSESIDTNSNTVLVFHPWFSKRSSEWMFRLGFDVAADITGPESDFYFHPKAFLKFHIVDHIMSSFIGLDGHLQHNNFKKITAENPFVVPALNVGSTNEKLKVYAGISGRLSPKASYNLRIDYSLIDDDYFYINDSLNQLGNQFIVTYDDIEMIHFFGELAYRYSDKLNLYCKADYYNYQMNNELHPWHRPDFELSLSAKYNLHNKILLNLDVIGIGNRYGKSVSTGNPVKLNGTVDINMELEYRYTKILSVFARINNFTGNKYYLWHQYPNQRFNLMAGITYAL